MGEPFLGEVRMFGTSYSPRFWTYCDGTQIQIEQNTALFALMGNKYGGNGTDKFAMPNLSGRAALNWGTGPGLFPHRYGGFGGEPFVPLTELQIPTHSHTLSGDSQVPEASAPDGAHVIGTLVKAGVSQHAYSDAVSRNLATMADQALSYAGGSNAHENRQPYLVIPFFVAMEGTFPSRN